MRYSFATDDFELLNEQIKLEPVTHLSNVRRTEFAFLDCR